MEYATTTDPETGRRIVEFACPDCGTSQTRPLDAAGEPLTCSQCGAAFRVPGDRERRETQPSKRPKPQQTEPRSPRHRNAPSGWPVTFTVVGTVFRVLGLILVWSALTGDTGPAFSSNVNLGMMNDRLVEAVIGGALLVCGVLEAVGARVFKGLVDATRATNAAPV